MFFLLFFKKKISTRADFYFYALKKLLHGREKAAHAHKKKSGPVLHYFMYELNQTMKHIRNLVAVFGFSETSNLKL